MIVFHQRIPNASFACEYNCKNGYHIEMNKNVKKLHDFVVNYNHSSIFPFGRMYLNDFVLKNQYFV
jgi:hypothetical protein